MELIKNIIKLSECPFRSPRPPQWLMLSDWFLMLWLRRINILAYRSSKNIVLKANCSSHFEQILINWIFKERDRSASRSLSCLSHSNNINYLNWAKKRQYRLKGIQNNEWEDKDNMLKLIYIKAKFKCLSWNNQNLPEKYKLPIAFLMIYA